MTEKVEQLKAAEAAAYLNVSRASLYRLWRRGLLKRREKGKGPARWPQNELDKYLQRYTK